MNTATCCSTAIPTVAIPTHRGWLLRAWLDLKAAWLQAAEAHRERARLRAEWRSLQGLGDATLRDIGLAERQPYQGYTLGVLDTERNRWN